MRLDMDLRHDQRLSLVGGITSSIFVQAEQLLNEDGDFWFALEFVAARKKMDSYRSVIDFLFVEIAVGAWLSRCKAYYDGRSKKQVIDWLTQEEIDCWDLIIVNALNKAVEWFRQKREDTWTQFRLTVLHISEESINITS